MTQIKEACGCCEGIEVITPQPTANRPGLSALSYRVGTHATFLETLLARLSSADFPKLAELTTREVDDPAIALLDAWARVADVLTFYNERIINENYLRTATERRSILELARLVGYKLRPGVASSVYLAYTIDQNTQDKVIIPKGARSQNIPDPGQLPQSFETSEELKARAKWNNLQPRLTRPQTQETIQAGDGTNQKIYLKGISTNLKPGDPLLIGYGQEEPIFHWIKSVTPDAASNRTCVVLTTNVISLNNEETTMFSTIAKETPDLIGELVQPATPQFANSQSLPRVLSSQFIRRKQISADRPGLSGIASVSPQAMSKAAVLLDTISSGDSSHRAAKAFAPVLQDKLSTAVENAKVTPDVGIKVYALRIKAAPFGHNAPLRPVNLNPNTQVMEYSEWATENPENRPVPSAMFTAVPLSGEAPLTVSFNNQSSGFIEEIRWSIDGEVSGAWNLQKTFNTAGTYSINLTVRGPGGEDSHSITYNVTTPIN
jgi:PKD domain